jgi:hypothetical protein
MSKLGLLWIAFGRTLVDFALTVWIVHRSNVVRSKAMSMRGATEERSQVTFG